MSVSFAVGTGCLSTGTCSTSHLEKVSRKKVPEQTGASPYRLEIESGGHA